MASPMPDTDPDEGRTPLPCSRYPQCRQECTWPACNEKPPVDQAAAWAAVLDRLEQLRQDRRPPTWRVRTWRRMRRYLRRPGETDMPDVPDTAAEWIANALADPEAPNGMITFRSARAVFELVRRFDATGRSGWESHEERQQWQR